MSLSHPWSHAVEVGEEVTVRECNSFITVSRASYEFPDIPNE